jgi:hypothetical protein
MLSQVSVSFIGLVGYHALAGSGLPFWVIISLSLSHRRAAIARSAEAMNRHRPRRTVLGV